MNVNNLTNVYNQNPTLQGQYTLQQYLDLYGGSSTPTATTTPTTSTPVQSGQSQGIINANINQFQNQGGGGGIGGLTLSPTRSGPTANFNINPFSNRTVPGKEGMSGQAMEIGGDKYFEDPGMLTRAKDKFGNIASGTREAYSKFKNSGIGTAMSTALGGPLGFATSMLGKMKGPELSQVDQDFIDSRVSYTSEGGIGNKDKYGINQVSGWGNYSNFVDDEADKTAEAISKATAKYSKMGWTPQAIAKQIKSLTERNAYYEKQKQEKIAAKNKAKARAQTALYNKIRAEKGQSYLDMAKSNAAGRDPSQGNSVTGHGKSGMGRNPNDRMAKGGRVGRSYFKGGIVSLRGK